MSIAEKIREAVAFTGFPCAQVSYNGEEKTYFSFNMDTRPEMFCDDEPDAGVCEVQLHLFAPFTLDTTSLRKKIKRAIFDAGFTYPEMVDASEHIRSGDGTEQHIVFEFEIETGADEE